MRRLALVIGVVGWALAAGARAQAVLRPNQIVGRMQFTNVNPEIVAALDRPTSNAVFSASHPPLHLSASCGPEWQTWPTQTHELTVNTTDEGLAYTVQARFSSSTDDSTYASVRPTTDPVLPEPAPDTQADLVECAGLLRVRFVDDSGNPAVVTDVRLSSDPLSGWQPLSVSFSHQATAAATSVSVLDMPVRGDGGQHSVSLDFVIGTDPAVDRVIVRLTRTLTFRCDEITETIINVDEPLDGGEPLPRIVGLVDVLGEQERRIPNRSTRVGASGPWGNYRDIWLDRDPSSGNFSLENLVPSGVTAPPTRWDVQAMSVFNAEERISSFAQDLSVDVPDTGTLDLLDTLVVDPAHLDADIRVAGPRDAPDPVLADLRVIYDVDGDGLSDGASATPSNVYVGLGSDRAPEVGLVWSGRSVAGMAGGFDAGRGDWIGDSELIVGGPNLGSSRWSRIATRLDFSDLVTPGNPPSYREASASVVFETPGGHADPAERVPIPVHVCTSEVYIGVISPDVLIYDPSVSVSGRGFVGIDFEGRQVWYGGSSVGKGTPLDRGTAANEGMVVLAVPEGDWDFRVGVTAVNPGGGTSSTAVITFPMHVGCGQIINATTDLRIEVNPPPKCTGPGLVRVTGRVTSVRPIARIAYQLDSDPWTDVCAPCASPDFAFDVNVPTASSSLLVKAWDEAGLSVSVMGFTGLTGEPSALDLDAARPPLLVRKSPAGLTLTWEPRPTDQYTVHQASLRTLLALRSYEHVSIASTCRMSGAQADLALPAENVYFLVTEACEFGNGSFGRDSFGRERPGAIIGCP